MDAKKIAKQILNEVGGKDNINEVYHCVTRLRFYLKEKSIVDLDNIKKIDGVMGAQYHTDQLQIIIGNEVNSVYEAVLEKTGTLNPESKQTKTKFRITDLFETMAAIFLPTIPVLAGTGMIKGLITIMTMFMGFDANSDVIVILNIAGDCGMYFFPFLVAWSASNRFKTDTAVSLALAGSLLYPTMTSGLANAAEPLSLFGLAIPFVKYAGSSIPIILTILVLSYVYKYVDKLVPKILRLVFTPMIVMLIMVPLMLVGIAPLASYIAKGLVTVVWFLYDLSPVVAGTIVGATRMLVVLTGMHLSLGAIAIENIATFGSDFLLPMNTMGTLALFGVCMGVWVKSKNQETKAIGASTAFSSFIGITEPGIYGILLKYKNALISVMIAGGAGGAIVGAFGGRATAYVNSCILSLPVFMGEGFWAVCVGMAVSASLGFILVLILGISEEDKNTETVIKSDISEVIESPLTGTIVKLSDVSEEIFATEKMGKGIAVDLTDGTIVAPFDGVITAIYPTKHAIGITSDSGIECIIHIGIDTAELRGKHFDLKVTVGQKVQSGDILLEVDLSEILKAGYSLVSPVIITNSNNYIDILAIEESGIIVKNEQLLMVIK